MSTSTVITGVQYTPGRWVGMAAGRVWLLGDIEPSDPVLATVWPSLLQGASVAQVRTVLGNARRNWAILRLDDDGAELVVHGNASAEVTYDPEQGRPPLQVQAELDEPEPTRVERFAVIHLRLPTDSPDSAAGTPALALGTGVVQACQIAIHADFSNASLPGSPTTGDGQPLSIASPAVESPVEQAVGDRPFQALFGKTVRPSGQEEPAAPVPAEWMAGMRRPEQQPGEPAAGATLPPPHTLTGPPALEEYRSHFEQLQQVEPPAPQPAQVSATGTFDDISWATVSDSPSPGPDPYESYHAAHPPASYQSLPALPVPSPPADHGVVPPSPPYGPIAPSSPYAPGPVPYPGPPPAPAAPAQPTGGGIAPELLATVQRAPAAPVATGPVIGAVRCSLGHLNPPAAQRCRLCGGVVPPQTPQGVPRPKLGVLRLSTGEVVPLDRGVILGRAPGAPDGFGPDEPYRIQLPSPDGSISRQHVEVVLQGWLVIVADLQSTNGTQVTPPGGLPEQLPSGGRRQIDNGWTVTLDATTWFRFEVTE